MRLDEDITFAFRKLLPRSEKTSCVRSATDTTLHTVCDGVATSVSIDGVAKVPTSSREMQSFAITGRKAAPRAATTEVATNGNATIQDSREASLVRKDEKEYFIENLSGFTVRKKAYSTVRDSMDTTLRKTHTSPPRWLSQPFNDRYRRAGQKKRQDTSRSQRQ